jgi:hypothetical protein
MQRRVPCLEKLERLTSFRPATPLNEIVDRVVAFFRKKTEEEWVVREPVGAVRSLAPK